MGSVNKYYEGQTKVESILQGYRVTGQILTAIEKKISYQKVYQGAGRESKNRPSRLVRQTTLFFTYQSCESAIAHQQSIAGWRLYVTNSRVNVFAHAPRSGSPKAQLCWPLRDRAKGLANMEFIVRRQLD